MTVATFKLFVLSVIERRAQKLIRVFGGFTLISIEKALVTALTNQR